MSKLFVRSVLVLAMLFGLLFAVGTGVLYYLHMPLLYAVVFAVGIVTLQYILSPYIIDWIYKINWVHPSEVSQEFSDYLTNLCSKRGIPVPKFGIIEDGNPNAFTYGHVPGDARLVVTRGVQQMLDTEEFHAVVAHEVGHIKHFDFIVMTFASLVPILLYILYRWTAGGRRSRDSQYAFIVGIGAYAAYIVSQYIVLFLSRVREYFADEHAAQSVNSANAMSTALIKIAYGLARVPQEELDAKGKKKAPALGSSQMMGSLGICNFSSASAMAVYSTTAQGTFSTDHMMKAMQWDLWNPWAKFFEIQSTHPLVARRVQAASKIAIARNETPQFPISMKPERSYWGEFWTDMAFLMMPYVGLIMAAATVLGFGGMMLSSHSVDPMQFTPKILGTLGMCVLVMGIGWMLRLVYSYKSNFAPAKIEELVGEVSVSRVRCIPVEIRGKVIGRGIPGLFWSKDLVMQDESGFITMIYRQPLGFIETLFGLFKAESLVGKDAIFRGWYRRGPSPYVELKEAIFEDGDSTRCYYNTYLWAGAVITTIAGLAMMLLGL